MTIRPAEDYSGQPPTDVEPLTEEAEGPAKRPVVYLPRSVKAWMIYCQSGEMRAHAMKEGYLADRIEGWTITWSVRLKEYECRKRGRAVVRTTVKAEAYAIARSDGHRRPRYEGAR